MGSLENVKTWLAARKLTSLQLRDEPLPDVWPATLGVKDAAALQWPDDCASRQAAAVALELACDAGQVESSRLERNLPSLFVSQSARLMAKEDGRDVPPWPQEVAVLVSAASFGRWLESERLVPSTHIAAWLAACGSQERGKLKRPPQAQREQEKEILRVIRQLGYEPKGLPPRKPGRRGVKAEVWAEIGVCNLFGSEGVFKKAWDRLRAFKDVKERPGL